MGTQGLRKMLALIFLLSWYWKTTEGLQDPTEDLKTLSDTSLERSPEGLNDAVWSWIYSRHLHPLTVPQLTETMIQRNDRNSEEKEGKYTASPLREGSHLRGFGKILHEALGSKYTNNRLNGPQQLWSGPVNKRGIGLFSLAVALAQRPTPPSKPMMHPVDLSAYPRRARFFIATMG
ncbi:hypothetical protein SK128_002600 [Halocaridina rubra]|uniref:Uncharacterized protein n=1 Tax=Halocaridina rubra TaxID=373956 RepID=A0AAN8XD52_HALRR